jgi:hypothetical protein
LNFLRLLLDSTIVIVWYWYMYFQFAFINFLDFSREGSKNYGWER